MFRVRQSFDRPRVADLAGAVSREIDRLLSTSPRQLRPGARVGVTAGSRGISSIDEIIRAAVEGLKARKLRPSIIPAMGSHGGATPEGQKALLAHYGITEEAMGCPIRAEMATRSLGRSPEGMEAFLAEAVRRFGRLDAIVCNAGISGAIAPAQDYPEDVFDRVLAVNLKAPFLACKYGLPLMNDGGAIVMTASVVAVTSDPGIAAYAASKHGLIGLMRTIAKEAAPRRMLLRFCERH